MSLIVKQLQTWLIRRDNTITFIKGRQNKQSLKISTRSLKQIHKESVVVVST